MLGSRMEQELSRRGIVGLVLCVVWAKLAETQMHCWWGVGLVEIGTGSMQGSDR